MTIEICLGSSCHVKGSKKIFALVEKAIKENKLEKKVKIAGTLCLGHCDSDGVNMRIDDEIVLGITEKNFDEMFKTRVLDVIK
ncbi:MAG: (2Fe-2S) ferredoxin domain-containing protein [Sphaerochaetaceae bacterium]|nr:(2Fe-2S) ferredoxin domain-containing protein [Sphaerochaetaceae bacterium]